MAESTTNMNLTVWNSLTDPYDSSQLVDNFVKLDAHNHASGKGVQVPNAGLVNSKVTVGNTDINLGAAATTLTGLTAVTATAFNGNATTATTLETARKINGTLFDGSANITTPYITSVANMPALPATGDEIYYQAATNVVWHLRYNGTQWDFIGGSLLRSDQESANAVSNGFISSTGSTDYGSIDGSSTTASIILPAFTGACLYRIEIWGSLSKGNSDAITHLFMSYRTTADLALDADSFSVSSGTKDGSPFGSTTSNNVTTIYSAGSANPLTGFRASTKTITGGTTLTAQFKQSATGSDFYVNRHGIAARPIFITHP